MKKPTVLQTTEWLAETSIGDDTILAQYDHNSDNYEIFVNGSVVWGSNGLNRQDVAEAVFDAVVETINRN